MAWYLLLNALDNCLFLRKCLSIFMDVSVGAMSLSMECSRVAGLAWSGRLAGRAHSGSVLCTAHGDPAANYRASVVFSGALVRVTCSQPAGKLNVLHCL